METWTKPAVPWWFNFDPYPSLALLVPHFGDRGDGSAAHGTEQRAGGPTAGAKTSEKQRNGPRRMGRSCGFCFPLKDLKEGNPTWNELE